MFKTYKCLEAGKYYLPLSFGDFKVAKLNETYKLDETEAAGLVGYFEENVTWKTPLNAQVVTTIGGIIPFSKGFRGATPAEKMKFLEVKFTSVGTMPAGAVVLLEVLDALGNVIETRRAVLGSLVSTTTSVYFNGSRFNKATAYVVSGVVPQASGANYTITVEAVELEVESAVFADITNNGLVSGVNKLQIKFKNADNENSNKGFATVIVAGDSIGTFAAASILNGIAAGTDGELIETADDQRFHLLSEADGDIDLDLTPTNAGTPTETVLTIKGIPADGDKFVFGGETYEFDTNGAVAAGNIAIDISAATNSDDVAVAVETAINAETGYMIKAVDAAGTPTETVLTFAVGAPSSGDVVTFGTEVYEYTTDGATPLTAPTNIRIDMTGAGGAFVAVTDHITAAQAFKAVFNANTKYKAEAVGAAAALTITAFDLYTVYNPLTTTTSITAPSTGAFPAATFGDGAGDSTPGVDPKVTITAEGDFVAMNTYPTTDPVDTNSYLSFPATTFGDGAGASTTGVDPTSFYWLVFQFDDGSRFISQRLPY